MDEETGARDEARDEARERALFSTRAAEIDVELENDLDVDDVLSRIDERANVGENKVLAHASRGATALVAAAACFAVMRGLSATMGHIAMEPPRAHYAANTIDGANGGVPACGLLSSASDETCEPASELTFPSWTNGGGEEIASDSRSCHDVGFSPSAPACEAVACGIDVTCARVGP
jgi:hypothetical protein